MYVHDASLYDLNSMCKLVISRFMNCNVQLDSHPCICFHPGSSGV